MALNGLRPAASAAAKMAAPGAAADSKGILSTLAETKQSAAAAPNDFGKQLQAKMGMTVPPAFRKVAEQLLKSKFFSLPPDTRLSILNNSRNALHMMLASFDITLIKKFLEACVDNNPDLIKKFEGKLQVFIMNDEAQRLQIMEQALAVAQANGKPLSPLGLSVLSFINQRRLTQQASNNTAAAGSANTHTVVEAGSRSISPVK